MIKTLIFTKRSVIVGKPFEGKRKLIFNKETPFQISAGDEIQILEGFCMERVSYVYYSLVDNTQEVHLATEDKNGEYPEIKLD